jgi:hypothetical protein
MGVSGISVVPISSSRLNMALSLPPAAIQNGKEEAHKENEAELCHTQNTPGIFLAIK